MIIHALGEYRNKGKQREVSSILSECWWVWDGRKHRVRMGEKWCDKNGVMNNNKIQDKSVGLYLDFVYHS